MEKIEFFRPRYIEQDGSMSVGFWMCENKKVDDGYFYRASDVDALLADVRRLVEAGKIRIDKWHNDTCSKVLIGGNESYMCDCGHEELKQAIAAIERHLEKVA